jgi:hypothetical protein
LTWEVEYTNEFEEWWLGLKSAEQDSLLFAVRQLEEHGPRLPYPRSSRIESSRHPNMRELRVQQGGQPLRVFYAFDPRHSAILLIGGAKTGDDRFYERLVPLADRLYDEHIETLRNEGLI